MKKLASIIFVIAIISIVRTIAFPSDYFTIVQSGIAQDLNKEQVEVEIDEVRSSWEETVFLVKQGVGKFYNYSGFKNATIGHVLMIVVGLFFIFLAIKYDYEPLLLIPIGAGVIIGNIPFLQSAESNLQLGVYQEGSVLNYLYFGVVKGIYPPLIFLGIGAMTDFSSLISKPRLMILGAAAQVGIFLTFLGALYLGFHPREAGAMGINYNGER